MTIKNRTLPLYLIITKKKDLLQVVGPRITPKVRTNNALSANEKLMIGLRFFAANDYYNTLADLQGININRNKK
jgi:hypothetical protein